MWNRMTLRTRAYLLLSALVLVTFGGGSVMVWYTYRMQNILGNIIDRNMEAFRSAGALQVALINQKGFLSYYFLDGDPDWLRQLGEYRQAFKERLSVARGFVETDRQRETLDRLESEYVQYTAIKDRVISYYTEGDRAAGAELHKKIRHRFFDLLNLCEEYKKLHTARIEELREKSHNEITGFSRCTWRR